MIVHESLAEPSVLFCVSRRGITPDQDKPPMAVYVPASLLWHLSTLDAQGWMDMLLGDKSVVEVEGYVAESL